MKTFFLIFTIAIFSPVLLAEVVTIPSSDKTSEDIPLKFELQKTEWKYSKIYIWGKVENKGPDAYESVKVSFECHDANGNFLGRISWYADPDQIEKGQVGYITGKHLDSSKKKPDKIIVKVMGDK